MTKKEFMEDLWGAEGDFIDTPLGLMTVALELAFAKIDIGSGIDGNEEKKDD